MFRSLKILNFDILVSYAWSGDGDLWLADCGRKLDAPQYTVPVAAESRSMTQGRPFLKVCDGWILWSYLTM